jgi:hypothetical protein
MGNGLWVMLLEAGAALCMLLGIVWATWPKGKPQQAADPAARSQHGNASGNKEGSDK